MKTIEEMVLENLHKMMPPVDDPTLAEIMAHGNVMVKATFNAKTGEFEQTRIAREAWLDLEPTRHDKGDDGRHEPADEDPCKP